MPLADIDLTDLDLFCEGFPHAVFAELRRSAPVFWHAPTFHTPDGTGFWVVSRHADCLAVTADAQTFSSEGAPATGATGGGTLIQDLPFGFAAGVLLNMMDDPRHQRIRRLVTPQVSPRALAVMETELRERTARIFDGLARRCKDGANGECDFLVDVAVELPLQAISILLGVPEQDRHRLMAWANATLDYAERELGESSPDAEEAAQAMARYGSELCAAKRKGCGGPTGAAAMTDMLASVACATIEGPTGAHEPLSDLEVLMFFNLLVIAGSETTRNAIALGLAAVLENPEQLARLRSDRSLLPTAVEEILRWSSPTLYNRRTATCDTELAGTPIKAGDKVTLWWASANFDESVFDDPWCFDVGRSPNPHLAFGYRSHFCLGANLARIEVRIVLEELLERFEHIEMAGPIERFRTNKHAGVRHMPIAFRLAGDRRR